MLRGEGDIYTCGNTRRTRLSILEILGMESASKIAKGVWEGTGCNYNAAEGGG